MKSVRITSKTPRKSRFCPALKAALAAELADFGQNCKLIIRQQALPDEYLLELTRVKIPLPIKALVIIFGIPSLLIVFILLVVLAVMLWLHMRLPQEEIAIRNFWNPFIKGGAVLVLAEAPLVFTGPDAHHEVPPGPLRLEVLPPAHPQDFEYYHNEKKDFKTLGEILEGAASQREKYDNIQRIYKGLQFDEIVTEISTEWAGR